MDTNQTEISNPELEQAMNEVAKNDNPEARESLYNAILASTLIISGSLSGQDNTQIAFRTIEHPPGHVILPAFTCVDALISFADSEVQWVALGAQALFQSILPGNITEVRVNPFRADQKISRPGGIVSRMEFSALAQGLLPQAAIADNIKQLKVAQNQVVIGEPQHEPPAEMVVRLGMYFRQIPGLQRGFLFQMGNQQANSTVIGLEFSLAPDSQIMQRIMLGAGEILRGVLPPGVFIDFMPLAPGPLLEAIRSSGRLIFER